MESLERALAVADVMKTPVTPPSGLNTAANPFASDARGAMRQADNCVIPSKDKMEPRRGSDLQNYAMSSAPSTIGEFYNDTLFAQHGTKLSRDTGSAFTELGSYSPPSGASMKFIGGQGKEVNGDLYFTTSAGVYTIDSVSGTPRLAGIQRPSRVSILHTNGNVDAGWCPKDAAVAYRALVGRRDANNNIKLSAPTGRIIAVNPADLTIAIGGLVRNTNVTTATLSAGVTHTFRTGDKLSLTLTGADIANFTASNNVVLSVTATTIAWTEVAANYVNVASVAITSGSKSFAPRVLLQSGHVIAGDFVQLFRTADVTGSGSEPGDECYLAYERTLSAADVSNGYVDIADTTPSSFLDTPLYTNDNTGDGQQAANDRPPLAKGLCAFDGRVFLLNTTGRHRLGIRLLGTGSGVSGLQTGDVIAVNARAYIAGTDFSVYTDSSASQNIDKTVADLSSVFGGDPLVLGVTSTVTHDGDNGTGGVQIEEVALASTFGDNSYAAGSFNAIHAATSRISAFGDRLASLINVTEASTTRTTNVVTLTTGTAHGFTTGDVVALCVSVDSGVDSNFPAGLKTVASTPSATTFTYAETGANATMSSVYYVYATTYKSIADTLPVMYSKPGLPDAVPLLNFIQDLPRGQTVLGGAALRGSLYVFLANGDIWTISGTYPYRVEKFDGTATLIAEGSLVEHSNRLHCLTTQGVVAISESGVEILDEAIKPDLLPIIAAETLAGTLGSIRACSYESDHQYRLYLSTTSSYAIYVYNSLYRRWTKQSDGRAWGVVRRSTNKLYEGHSTLGRAWVERKTYTRSDHADSLGSLTFSAGSGTTATSVPTAFSGQIAVGDILNSGSSYWTVTAVTGSVGTQSVTGTRNSDYGDGGVELGAWAGAGGGTVTIFRAFTSTLQWLHDSHESPHNEKQWRDLVLHFSRHSVSSSTATFRAIEGSSAATGTISATAPQAYSFATAPTLPISKRVNVDDVDTPTQVSPQLAVGMTVAECFAMWTLLGYTLEVEEGTERMVT